MDDCQGSHKDEMLLSTLAEQCMMDFSSQGPVITAWAFATVVTVGHKEERLFSMLEAAAAAAEQRMRDFHSQELTNTAWAFATVGHKDERLFSTLAAAAEQRMRHFNSQELANTAWAFATVGHKDEHSMGVCHDGPHG